MAVVVSLITLGAALAVLRAELRTVAWHDLTRDALATPWPRLAGALTLTALNYVVLTGYDLLAFRYVRRVLPVGRIAGAAFVAYAISHNVGFAALSGASIRYRFYSRWGVSAEELTRIVFSYSLTFWLGLALLGGLSLIASPIPRDLSLPAAALARPVGVLCLAGVAAMLAASYVRREPLRVGRLAFPLPSPALVSLQLTLSSVDWLLAGAVLFVLLPHGGPPFPTFVGAFLVATLLGTASHVPGGIGVFEGLMVLLLEPWLAAPLLLPAFLLYRAIYYLVPFAIGLTALVLDELGQRRHHVVRAVGWMGHATRRAAPRALSALTFLSGVVLLMSGATPAARGRLDLLGRLLPLGVIEVSHFFGSVAGAGLLVLSHGLARRLDAAYYMSASLIVLGMAAAVLKGGDVEEAVLLLVMLVVLIRARPAFDRKAAFLATRFSPGWMAAVTGAIGASVWLGLFAFRHVDYAADLWWRVELFSEASRFLRASIGAAVMVLLTAIARLMSPAPHERTTPDTAVLEDASRIIGTQESTSANLVFLRDKSVIVDAARRAFLMYGVQGRTWVALHDPVGPADQRDDLIREFLERADDYGGTPVFYEVAHDGLHRYADHGLVFARLGEEALVDLRTFSLESRAGSKSRQAMHRLEREGGTFRVIDPGDVPAHLPRLRAISDKWLADRAGAEKGFSLGFFDDAYLRRFPVAVVERADQITAFATLWPGAGQVELSMDLMRFARDAPKGVMEALLTHVMLWGQAQGYRRCSLGMAPLSGFEASPVASLWQRVGTLIYEHGEPLYGFQGLRAFKAKFNPTWEPRYLAYPGGLALPRILADVSALIAGGYRRIFMR